MWNKSICHPVPATVPAKFSLLCKNFRVVGLHQLHVIMSHSVAQKYRHIEFEKYTFLVLNFLDEEKFQVYYFSIKYSKTDS